MLRVVQKSGFRVTQNTPGRSKPVKRRNDVIEISESRGINLELFIMVNFKRLNEINQDLIREIYLETNFVTKLSKYFLSGVSGSFLSQFF